MEKDFYLKNKIYFLNIKYLFFILTRDILMGIGDWGLGIGAQSPIPNPPSPIPHTPFPNPIPQPLFLIKKIFNKIK